MDAGYAREFDYPHILLQQSDSILTGMVEAVGQSESDQLKKMAHDTYMEHHLHADDDDDDDSNQHREEN